MSIDNVIFVCQKGKLELEAKILATSIRYKWGDDFRVVAAVPHSINELGANTIEVLEALKVEVLEIKNISFHKYITHYNSPYLHGNKIDACREFTIKGNNLLIDTDTFVLNKLPSILQDDINLSGSIARGVTCTLFKDENKDLLKSVVGELGGMYSKLKYYNSGVIFYSAESGFQDLWSDMTHKVIERPDIRTGAKFPWADQISFSVITTLEDIVFEELPALEFNSPFPGWRLNNPTYIHHYHNLWRNFQNRRTYEYLLELESFLNVISPGSKIFYELPLRQDSYKVMHAPFTKKVHQLQLQIDDLQNK